MPISVATNLDYLIEDLRVQLGDTDSTAYRYLDEWLRTSLVMGVKALQRWWNYKYLVDDTYNIYRNPGGTYIFPNPPIIEPGDERPIVLMSSIVTKEGTLQGSAWTVGSWKDAEISYSNIEASKLRQSSLAKDWEELTSILKIPQKKLLNSYKSTLPGFKDNPYEVNGK